MQNNKTNNNTNKDLRNTTVDINPTGYIYTLKGSDVAKYVEDYLSDKNIDGVSEVRAIVKNEGRSNNTVPLYLFMNSNNKHIFSSISNIPPLLRKRMAEVNVGISDNFRNVLIPLCGKHVEYGKAEHNEYFVKLDIFRVLGLMLAARMDRHNISIPEVMSLPGNKDCVLSVIKMERFASKSSSRDNYSKQIENIERRR